QFFSSSSSNPPRRRPCNKPPSSSVLLAHDRRSHALFPPTSSSSIRLHRLLHRVFAADASPSTHHHLTRRLLPSNLYLCLRPPASPGSAAITGGPSSSRLSPLLLSFPSLLPSPRRPPLQQLATRRPRPSPPHLPLPFAVTANWFPSRDRRRNRSHRLPSLSQQRATATFTSAFVTDNVEIDTVV
ncbi:hypothetical protein Tsubulata_023184, partial [Turnera subulata]